jgi:hypothetical protein
LSRFHKKLNSVENYFFKRVNSLLSNQKPLFLVSAPPGCAVPKLSTNWHKYDVVIWSRLKGRYISAQGVAKVT